MSNTSSSLQQLLPFTVLKLICRIMDGESCKLQQLLPFTVLKHFLSVRTNLALDMVATALTVYGIETYFAVTSTKYAEETLQQLLPFTVLKLKIYDFSSKILTCRVATALTVYGIETALKQ